MASWCVFCVMSLDSHPETLSTATFNLENSHKSHSHVWRIMNPGSNVKNATWARKKELWEPGNWQPHHKNAPAHFLHLTQNFSVKDTEFSLFRLPISLQFLTISWANLRAEGIPSIYVIAMLIAISRVELPIMFQQGPISEVCCVTSGTHTHRS